MATANPAIPEELARFSAIFLGLQYRISIDAECPTPSANIFFGGEHVSEQATAPRIIFVPIGGPLGPMLDHSGHTDRAFSTTKRLTAANPVHIRTWRIVIGCEVWGNVPQWTPSTAFTVNQCVQNATSGDRAQYFICSTAGVSAASGTGPLGSGPITDGSVTWQSATANAASLYAYDDATNRLNAVVRACNATMRGSCDYESADWSKTSMDKARSGRAIHMKMTWLIPMVGDTFPTVTGPFTPVITPTFT